MAYALLRGFNLTEELLAKGVFSPVDTVVTLDADGPHNPEEIKEMYDYFKKHDFDLLIRRTRFDSYPRYRIIGNRFTSAFASVLSGRRFEDVECGLKIMKVSFIHGLLAYYNAYRYSCSGVIGIYAGLMGFRVDNTYKVGVPNYRKRGPGIADFFINLLFYITAAFRIYFYRFLRHL